LLETLPWAVDCTSSAQNDTITETQTIWLVTGRFCSLKDTLSRSRL
jgi:hypothetical protein